MIYHKEKSGIVEKWSLTGGGLTYERFLHVREVQLYLHVLNISIIAHDQVIIEMCTL